MEKGMFDVMGLPGVGEIIEKVEALEKAMKYLAEQLEILNTQGVKLRD